MHSTTNENPADSLTVILTGSTGSLGSYLLDSLIKLHHVKKVYCLNRGEDAKSKQSKVSGTRGLNTDWKENRVEFLQVDLSRPELGLSQGKYRQLLAEATHIIHNQWPVNFNWDLSSFEPSIRGVRHLLDFCLDSPRQVDFFFISTIGTVSYVKAPDAVPERPNYALSPHLGGYSASKLICELIIEEHVKTTGHKRAAICRVGQIAGPVLQNGGMWNKQEWLPTIIESSKHMGLLPSSLGSMDTVNWVPVDLLSQIILELSGVAQPPLYLVDKFSREKQNASQEVAVYHTVNPKDISWGDLVPTVANLLGLESGSIVSWNQWVNALRLSENSASSVEANPGLKLLDFFESLGGRDTRQEDMMQPALATKLSAAKSKTLASLEAVGTGWMTLWLKQWES